MKLLGSLMAILLFFSINIFADTKMEIDHLLDFVAKTTCKYERNGTLHAGPEAKEHILKKYEYFNNKEKIHSAEDFILYSATKSELSGKRYRVQCSVVTEDSSDWLLRELADYRKKQP